MALPPKIERYKIGCRIKINNHEILVAGATPDGRPLMVRKWIRGGPDKDDLCNLFTGDSHLFAPTVRQLRTRHGYTHDLHAKKGIVDLYGKHDGGTIVIMGCGPSMKEALPFIRELHDKHEHITICPNVTLQHGYAPICDYYMILCWLSQAWWWKGVDTSKLKCITSFHTPNEVIRDFPDRYYFDDTYVDVTVDEPEERKKFGVLDGGMTVIFSALHLAFKMGAKRVVLAGMDLSYTDYMDHPDDPLSYSKAKTRKTSVVKDIFGNAVLTDETYLAHRDILRGQLELLQESGVQIINITNHGILDTEYGICVPPETYLQDVRDGVEYACPRIEFVPQPEPVHA